MVIPRQLPGAVRHFIDRSVEQDALTTLLAGAKSDSVVLISTVDGIAGVGKSTLVVHWAHRVRDRFPDGELYVNLRGFDPVAEPLPPDEVLAVFLAALDVPHERVPEDLDARAALFRSLLHGRRMLVVLDNARSAGQIRPLLPGGSTSLVLVTSRNRLDELVVRDGASRVPLEVLGQQEARELLSRYLGQRRLESEHDSINELIRHCAGLPLALGIAAIRAAENPDFPLDDLMTELRDERERLDALDAGGETGVRAVFSWSYRSLSPAAGRMFRLLGLPTGPDISLAAAADLAGVTQRTARGLLAELTKANLLEQRTHGRYEFHDLLRAYAAECAANDESDADRDAAIRRLLDHYLRTSYAADRRLTAHVRTFAPELPESEIVGLRLDDYDEALAWWDRERANLLAAVRHASIVGSLAHVWQTTYTLMYFFKLRSHVTDALTVYEMAISAARQVGDRRGEAELLHDLGVAYYERKDYDRAAQLAEESIGVLEQLGEHHRQGEALVALGHALVDAGKYEAAIQPLEQSIELAYEVGNVYGQGLAHAALGLLYSKLGQLNEALPHFQDALTNYQEVGELFGHGFVLNNRADAYFNDASYTEAIDDYRRAVVHRREIGHRLGEAASLRGLGNALRRAGDRDGAHESLSAAIELFEELGSAEASEVQAEIDGLATS